MFLEAKYIFVIDVCKCGVMFRYTIIIKAASPRCEIAGFKLRKVAWLRKRVIGKPLISVADYSKSCVGIGA
jgi:hypothetical protein